MLSGSTSHEWSTKEKMNHNGIDGIKFYSVKFKFVQKNQNNCCCNNKTHENECICQRKKNFLCIRWFIFRKRCITRIKTIDFSSHYMNFEDFLTPKLHHRAYKNLNETKQNETKQKPNEIFFFDRFHCDELVVLIVKITINIQMETGTNNFTTWLAPRNKQNRCESKSKLTIFHRIWKFLDVRYSMVFVLRDVHVVCVGGFHLDLEDRQHEHETSHWQHLMKHFDLLLRSKKQFIKNSFVV